MYPSLFELRQNLRNENYRNHDLEHLWSSLGSESSCSIFCKYELCTSDPSQKKHRTLSSSGSTDEELDLRRSPYQEEQRNRRVSVDGCRAHGGNRALVPCL